MGEVINLRAWQRHARASARASLRLDATGRRACIVASAASDTPRIRRRDAALTSGDQYATGMRPRCAHLRTAGTEAPMSLATTSSAARFPSAGQSPNSLRGESIMPLGLGQSVLTVKTNVSHDTHGTGAQIAAAMAKKALSEFEKDFIARTRAARAQRYTQAEISELLDVDQGKWKHYETRSALPLELISRFCTACGITLEWMIEGKGRGPAVQPLPAPRPRPPRRKRRVAA